MKPSLKATAPELGHVLMPSFADVMFSTLPVTAPTIMPDGVAAWEGLKSSECDEPSGNFFLPNHGTIPKFTPTTPD